MNEIEESQAARHEWFMRRCIELARIAKSRNDTPVGSIVILDGQIVGEGIEALPTGGSVTGHAEVLACQAAVDRTGDKLLKKATLYSTAEPCFMCSYVIRQLGISLVVYSLDTPHIGGVTSSHPILTDSSLSGWGPAPNVVAGVLHDESEHLMSTKPVT